MQLAALMGTGAAQFKSISHTLRFDMAAEAMEQLCMQDIYQDMQVSLAFIFFNNKDTCSRDCCLALFSNTKALGTLFSSSHLLQSVLYNIYRFSKTSLVI